MAVRGARYEAQQLGSPKYKSTCKKHGEVMRFTSGGNCQDCSNENYRRRYAENPEPFLEKRSRQYWSDPERWKMAQAHRRLTRCPFEYVEVLEVARIRSRAWRKDNPGHRNYLKSIYRAAKIKRTPAWVNKDEIAEFYRACPKGFHVDHVIPLRGKTVCGLHVIGNLQYLPAIENVRKGNKIA